MIVVLVLKSLKEIVMKTDYRFGVVVEILQRKEDSKNYSSNIKVGDVGFVVGKHNLTFPVEVQFIGHSECFLYEELRFLNSNIKEE